MRALLLVLLLAGCAHAIPTTTPSPSTRAVRDVTTSRSWTMTGNNLGTYDDIFIDPGYPSCAASGPGSTPVYLFMDAGGGAYASPPFTVPVSGAFFHIYVSACGITSGDAMTASLVTDVGDLALKNKPLSGLIFLSSVPSHGVLTVTDTTTAATGTADITTQ